MTAPKPLTDLTDVERTYLRLIRAHGRPAPTTKQYEPQAPVADDGQSDCWTHAWNLARRIRGTYVEGIVVRPGANGPSFHAWVETDNPLIGRSLVEATPGYEHAQHYLGITIDNAPRGKVSLMTARWHIRASVIQAALAGGGTPDQVLNAVTRKAS